MLDPAAHGRGVGAGCSSSTTRAVSAAIDDYQQGFTWLRDPRFVSIAAVQGYAIGAGFQLALSCDLRVLTDDAQFSMKESALGLVPDLTGTKPLVEAVGYARALEICATARMVGAAEAVDIGLALTAVPADQLDATVADLVAALTAPLRARCPRPRRLLQSAAATDLDEQRRLEREAQARRFRELAPADGGPARGLTPGAVREVTPMSMHGAGPGAAFRHLRSDRSVVNNQLDRGTVRRVVGFARPHRGLISVFLAPHRRRRRDGRRHPAAGPADRRRRHPQGRQRAWSRWLALAMAGVALFSAVLAVARRLALRRASARA